jgi:Zn-dependent M32 family carboxypeptidase
LPFEKKINQMLKRKPKCADDMAHSSEDEEIKEAKQGLLEVVAKAVENTKIVPKRVVNHLEIRTSTARRAGEMVILSARRGRW